MRLIYYYILPFIVFGYSEKPYFNTYKLNKPLIQKIERGEVVTIKTKKNFGKGEHYQVYGIVDANIKALNTKPVDIQDLTPSEQVKKLTKQIDQLNIILDKNSGEPRLSHQIDLSTGIYNGKTIFINKKKPDNTK